MPTHKNICIFTASSRQEWRDWLHKNHEIEKSVWLLIHKKDSEIPSVYYPEAVDEALCFGWIDSVANKYDEKSYLQYFAKRKSTSNWSAVNKLKVEKLIAEGLMTEAGMNMIDLAKKTGTWNALDKVDQLVIPDDLLDKLNTNMQAKANFENFAASAKRGILEWILNAKKPETRQKRIDITVEKATENKKANFPS